ncbi:MAG: IS110 family transposase [Gemmatimonadetes bacterium]|nr:IS110 family transposase [Gemmatimonadota bacterium]
MTDKTTDKTTYVGIDIGKRNCAVCVMDRDGNVLENIKYRNTREAVGKLAKTLLSKYGKCSAVCESTSKMWMKTYEVFEEYHLPIILERPGGIRLRRESFLVYFVPCRYGNAYMILMFRSVAPRVIAYGTNSSILVIALKIYRILLSASIHQPLDLQIIFGLADRPRTVFILFCSIINRRVSPWETVVA